MNLYLECSDEVSNVGWDMDDIFFSVVNYFLLL